jgi:hypothetical protein
VSPFVYQGSCLTRVDKVYNSVSLRVTAIHQQRRFPYCEALPFFGGGAETHKPDKLAAHFSTFWQPAQQVMASSAPAPPHRMRLIDDFLTRAPAPPCLPRARPAPAPRRQPSTRVKQPRIHFGSEHEYVRIYILKAPAL